jgi:hypothetical protein
MKPKLLALGYIFTTVIWAVLSYFQLFAYLPAGEMFARSINGRPYISDFVNCYNAGLLAKSCLTSSTRPNIYDPVLQDESERRLIAPIAPESPFYYYVPPYCFVLMMPLVLVSMPAAWCLWNLIFVGLSVSALYSLTEGQPPRTRWLLVILAVASSPFWVSIELGQQSLAILPLAIWTFQLFKKKRYCAAGMTAGLLALKVQYLPAFAVMGLCAGGLPFALGVFITVAALCGASVLLLGWENVARFPAAMLTHETGSKMTGVNFFMMQNLRGQLWFFLHGQTALLSALTIAGMLAGLLVLFLLWRRYHKFLVYDVSSLDRVFAASIFIALLTSIHTHVQDFALASIPACICWQLCQSSNTFTPKRRQAVLILLWLYPLCSWIFLLAEPLFHYVLMQPFFLWGLCLLILIMPPQPKDTDCRSYPQQQTDDQRGS